MKTVSGVVESTKPVSLSKAAKILSNFASSDNGASPAFAAYLKRSSASFDELAQLHKKYKNSGGEHKVKSTVESRKLQEVSTEEKDNISVVRDEIKEVNRVKKVKEEAKTIEVDEERKHKSKKRSKDEEKKHKSKKRSKDEGRHHLD